MTPLRTSRVCQPTRMRCVIVRWSLCAKLSRLESESPGRALQVPLPKEQNCTSAASQGRDLGKISTKTDLREVLGMLHPLVREANEDRNAWWPKDLGFLVSRLTVPSQRSGTPSLLCMHVGCMFDAQAHRHYPWDIFGQTDNTRQCGPTIDCAQAYPGLVKRQTWLLDSHGRSPSSHGMFHCLGMGQHNCPLPQDTLVSHVTTISDNQAVRCGRLPGT